MKIKKNIKLILIVLMLIIILLFPVLFLSINYFLTGMGHFYIYLTEGIKVIFNYSIFNYKITKIKCIAYSNFSLDSGGGNDHTLGDWDPYFAYFIINIKKKYRLKFGIIGCDQDDIEHNFIWLDSIELLNNKKEYSINYDLKITQSKINPELMFIYDNKKIYITERYTSFYNFIEKSEIIVDNIIKQIENNL